MKRKADTLLAVILVSVLVLMVGIGCQRAGVDQAAAVDEAESKGASTTADAAKAEANSPEEGGAEARAGDGNAVANSGKAEARAGNGKARATAKAGNGEAKDDGAVAGDDEAKAEKDDGVRPGGVKLKIGGEPGTRFSGTCAVGGEEREVSGRVPGRFVYEPDGPVECDIRKEGSGQLKFFVKADGGNQKQKIKVTGDTVSFSFSGDSVSYSSSSASGAQVQKSKVTSSSSSSVSSSSGR